MAGTTGPARAISEVLESANMKREDLAFVDQAGTKTFADLCQSVGLRIPYEDGCIREVGSGIRDWIRENRPAEA